MCQQNNHAPASGHIYTNTEGRFFCVDRTMNNELNQGMKGVLSHSGDGSCCANFTMNARDQNTEEPSPCVNQGNSIEN